MSTLVLLFLEGGGDIKWNSIDDNKKQCGICFKIYVSKHHMERHMTTHGGIKFKCNYCESRSFTYKDNLTRHMRKCHLDKLENPDIVHLD
jgi:uncharacterized Zn-finger protein